MIRSLSALSLLILATALGAQVKVTEIKAMTVPHSVIDMDKVGKAGPTTEALVNLAGTGGGGCLAGIVLTPTAVTTGVYNTNPGQGRALGLDVAQKSLTLVDPPAGQFGSFDARLDLAMPCTEIGFSIGDWNGTRTVDFYLKGQVVLKGFTTTSFTGTALLKYFQMTGGTFDRVDITGSGNWVIPDIVTQIPPNSYTPYGAGCKGAGGVPAIMAKGALTPKIGTAFQVEVTGMPLPASPGLMGVGTRGTAFGALGNLPFDLTPLGATGCRLWTSWFLLVPFGSGGGKGTWVLAIPNDPILVGARFYNQAYVQNPGANPLGVLLSNAAVGTIVQ